MKIIENSDLSFVEKETICQLWNKEYPEKISYNSVADFEIYLSNLSNLKHYLLQDELAIIQGWAITFIRENEIWFAIIINSKVHNRGFGTQFLNHLKSIEKTLSGWVIDHNNDIKLDGTPYVSPLNFYLKNGFSIDNNIRINSQKITAVKIVWR